MERTPIGTLCSGCRTTAGEGATACDVTRSSGTPFHQGLLLSLPEKLGADWSAADRIKWLQTAADQFDLMFKGGAPIVISQAAPPRTRAVRKSNEDGNKGTV
jgi:hypothetical protein